METKTEMESDLHLTVQPTMTVGEVQKEVEKRLGWLPTSQLKRHLSLLPHSARCCAISVCSRCIDCLSRTLSPQASSKSCRLAHLLASLLRRSLASAEIMHP